MKNKGISLITLIITIVVVIILTMAVIFALGNNNPIESANKANVMSSVDSFKSQLIMSISKIQLNTEKEQSIDSDETKEGYKILDLIPIMKDKKLGKINYSSILLVRKNNLVANEDALNLALENDDITQKQYEWLMDALNGVVVSGVGVPSEPVVEKNTIKYHKYDGTVEEKSKIKGDTYIIEEIYDSREGFFFIEYNTAEDTSGISYTVGDEYALDENLDLYEIWVADKYYFEVSIDNNLFDSLPATVNVTVKNNNNVDYTIANISYTISIDNSDYTILASGGNTRTISGGSMNSDTFALTISKDGDTSDDELIIDFSVNKPCVDNKKIKIGIVDGKVKDFSYNGGYRGYKIPFDGTYKIEAWGAQGGNAGSYVGGKGAYTCGEINLTKGTDLFIYIGGNNGYNGGGAQQGAPGANGGGATDIRLELGTTWKDFNSLKSRIMVAAGGGGAQSYYCGLSGGDGGTLQGLPGKKNGSNGALSSGATQIDAGTGANAGSGGFGYGGTGVDTGGGGGSGYYGAWAGSHTDGTVGSGGGGSSYISGYPGCVAIDKDSVDEQHIVHLTGDSNHYSGKIFTNYTMTAGVNTGDGKARITVLSKK